METMLAGIAKGKSIGTNDMRELIEKLEHGVMVCSATGTSLVHLDVEDVRKILNALQTDDGQSTPDEIEALLNVYGYSLNVLPRPTNEEFAYTLEDREDAAFRASEFAISKPNNAKDAIEEVFDFICHQSDVIELLIKALKVANKT